MVSIVEYSFIFVSITFVADINIIRFGRPL